jgi:hypothetical protein
MRWWDGTTWAGPASIPQPPGRRLPGWAKTCFAVGIAVGAANLLFVTLALFIVAAGWLVVGAAPHEVHRTAELWELAALGLAIASLAAAVRGQTRLRLGALVAAIAVMAGSWAWYELTQPPRPQPTLAELKKSPAAQLIYPGAVVATQLTRERDSYWEGADSAPATFVRDEATNDTWPQVLAWFHQRLTADGWTETEAASSIGSGPLILAWSWKNGDESFTLSVYSEAGRDALYQQAPELRGRSIAVETYLY